MLYSGFEITEFNKRWEKCQKEMDKQGLDVLILSQDTNIIYMTGYRTGLFDSNFRPFFCVLTKGKEPTLLVPNLEGPSAKKEAWFEDIETWGAGGKAESPIDLLIKFFKDNNLLDQTIGMELDYGQRLGVTQEEFNSIKQGLPSCQFKSCSALMWKLREIKSKREVEFLKEACRISFVAFDAVVNSIKLGMTERDLQKIMFSTMGREGSDLDGFLAIASGNMRDKKRWDMCNPFPSDRELKKGDMIMFDFGAVYRGYWADVTRDIFIGPVSEIQRELFNVELKIHLATTNAAKPGVSVGEITKAAHQAIKESGHEDMYPYRGRVGHGIGLEVHEMPSVGIENSDILKPGMVICIEPSLRNFSLGAPFKQEDNIVITEDGYEYLYDYNREIIIV